MIRHLRSSSLFLALMGAAAAPCFAGAIYGVTIDTGSASGQAGAIYMQFQPGLNADPASVRITEFRLTAPGALSGVPPPEFTPGSVTGGLDALPLEISNAGGWNYYLHYLTFGARLDFTVAFNVPSPLVGDGGSMFSFGLTAEDGITPILTVDPYGFIGEIGYDLSGNYAVTSLSNVVTFTPEPATWALAGVALAALMAVRRRKEFKLD